MASGAAKSRGVVNRVEGSHEDNGTLMLFKDWTISQELANKIDKEYEVWMELKKEALTPAPKTGYCFDWTPNDQKCPLHKVK